jgi:hypothetical protein
MLNQPKVNSQPKSFKINTEKNFENRNETKTDNNVHELVLLYFVKPQQKKTNANEENIWATKKPIMPKQCKSEKEADNAFAKGKSRGEQ